MSREMLSQSMVGNDFALPHPHVRMAVSLVTPEPAATITALPLKAMRPPRDFSSFAEREVIVPNALQGISNTLHHYSLATFALLFLLVIGSGIKVAASFESAHLASMTTSTSAQALKSAAPILPGLNMTVASNQLPAKIQSITNQTATLKIGSQQVPIGASTIRSWLQVTSNQTKAVDYIHVNMASIISSINQLADTYIHAPLNQVTVTHTDGITPSGVIINGQNGSKLTDPNSLTAQAAQFAKNVMNGSGLSFSAALQTVPFQAVTPAAFHKLLEVDVTTKRMYAYLNGQLVNTFLVSAGKPSTPTPIGEFHIWDKLTSQTMSGPGYVQPNVPWINYFDHSGDAIHGNYWRPASVFGNVNTSHGCVGLQDAQAEWVYNWAPIGTTVITYK